MTPCFFVKSAKRSDRQKKLCYNGFKDIGLCYWKNLIKIKRLFLIPILIQVRWMAAQSCACHFFQNWLCKSSLGCLTQKLCGTLRTQQRNFLFIKLNIMAARLWCINRLLGRLLVLAVLKK